MTFQNPAQPQIFEILKKAKTIAVVGLSDKPERISYQVAQVMQEAGYRIIPVNPVATGQTILGEQVYASLKDLPEKVDIVDIFRKSEALPALAKEFLESGATVFWAQLGIENAEAAEILAAAGVQQVVMDRCIKVDYQKMLETEGMEA